MSRVQLDFCKALKQSKLPITYISYTWLKASNEAQFECLPIEQWHIYDDVFLCFCESIGLLAISTFAFVPRLVAGFVSKRLLKHNDTKFKCLFKKMYVSNILMLWSVFILKGMVRNKNLLPCSWVNQITNADGYV